MAKSPIQVGGPYVENEDHVPSPTDMVAQFNTSGTGAHGVIEKVAPVFDVDKVKTAQEIVAALDPENTSVPASRVVLPSVVDDNDQAKKDLLAAAKGRIKAGVTIGEPDESEQAAALEGDEGVLAAVDQERGNAASNSTGNSNAGQHDGSVSNSEGHDDTKKVGSGSTEKAKATKSADSGSTAKTTSSSPSSSTTSKTASKTADAKKS